MIKTDMSTVPGQPDKNRLEPTKKNGEARTGGLSCTVPVPTYGKKNKLEGRGVERRLLGCRYHLPLAAGQLDIWGRQWAHEP